jgi:hypothetical protein
MPIHRLLQNRKLSLEQKEMLNLAFIRTLRVLGLQDRNDPLCELVARKIIEVSARADDPIAVSQLAIGAIEKFVGAPPWLDGAACINTSTADSRDR